MAELDIKNEEVVGIKKEIEEGSLELIFNALQSDIYSHPIRSFIRETISNGLDSHIEKNVFRKIQGGDPVDKYFLQRQDGALLKDSEYDPGYYDEQYLSHNSKVIVTYKDGSPRDTISIMDEGVALGGNRLKGYFKLGWSSKRNFLTARGLYGLGSKAALATGVDYFTMTTVYNGYKTTFMIYSRDYEPITPDSPSGKLEVWTVTMANGEKVDKNIYWEKTHEMNSVTVSVEVKKHNKKRYIEAVKEQFQYFNGAVTLIEQYEHGGEIRRDLLNDVPEFESEALLIPKYSTYSSPHILVDGISYGLVHWDELELETRRGKIALKVSANQVDITQSRESLKWTDKTKKTIVNSIKLAEDQASEYVRANIVIDDEDNIFALNDAYSTLSENASFTVTNVFSRFLSMHTIRPKYTVDLDKKGKVSGVLGTGMFEFLFYSYDFKSISTYNDGGRLKIRTEVVRDFDSVSNAKLIFSREASLGPKLAAHLLDKFNVSSIIYVRENFTRVKSIISLSKLSREFNTSDVRDYADNLITKYNHLFLDNYEVVYDETEEELEDSVLEDNKVNQSRLRKMNKEIMWYSYEYKEHNTYNEEIMFHRTKNIRKIEQLSTEFKNTEVVVVPTNYLKLGKMIVMMEELQKSTTNFEIVFVSEDNSKHFMNMGGIHITNYFRKLDPKTGALMIGEKIMQINTAYQFKKLEKKYNAFADCSEIISALSSINEDEYKKFTYKQGNSLQYIMEAATQDKDLVKEVFSYLDSLAEFQTILAGKDKDAIAKKALELFDTDKIYHVEAYDKDYIDSVEKELERLNPIAPIISAIDTYTESCTPLLTLLLETIHKNQ